MRINILGIKIRENVDNVLMTFSLFELELKLSWRSYLDYNNEAINTIS